MASAAVRLEEPGQSRNILILTQGFPENGRAVFQRGCTFYIHRHWWDPAFPTPSPALLTVFLVVAMLVGVTWPFIFLM